MQVERIYVQHVKGAHEIEHDLTGHHLYIIGGKNGEGKSSGGIDAFLYALRGTRSIPDKALMHGQENGIVEVDLTGWSDVVHSDSIKVTRKFYPDGKSKLVITDQQGYRAPTPQKLLDDLCGETTFDPLHFTKLTATQQAETLRELVGVDFTELEKQKRAALDQKNESTRHLQFLREALTKQPRHPEVPSEPLSSKDLMDALAVAEEHNHNNARIRREADKLRESLNAQATACQRQQEAVDRLAQQLKEAQQLLDKMVKDQAALGASIEQKDHEVSQLKDRPIEDIRSQLEDLSKTNAKIEQNRVYLALKQDVRKAETEVRVHSEKAAKIRQQKRQLLEQAKWPVPGLGFDEQSGVVYNNTPFEQLSSAEQLKISVSIGIASAPELKTFTIKEGALLDNDTLQSIAEQVKQAGCQLIVEMVTRTSSDESLCSVIIEDGRIKNDAVAGENGAQPSSVL